jgi:hypothetical protein
MNVTIPKILSLVFLSIVVSANCTKAMVKKQITSVGVIPFIHYPDPQGKTHNLFLIQRVSDNIWSDFNTERKPGQTFFETATSLLESIPSPEILKQINPEPHRAFEEITYHLRSVENEKVTFDPQAKAITEGFIADYTNGFAEYIVDISQISPKLLDINFLKHLIANKKLGFITGEDLSQLHDPSKWRLVKDIDTKGNLIYGEQIDLDPVFQVKITEIMNYLTR